MSYLLDTNAVSEFKRPLPNPSFVAWLESADESSLYLSVASFAELRAGVDAMPRGARRRALNQWLSFELVRRFAGRITGIDLRIADEWGRISAARRARGRAIEAMDALIAASANVLELTLVTRNVRHFEGVATKLHNPWSPD